MRVSEIRVNQIRVNQGLCVYGKEAFDIIMFSYNRCLQDNLSASVKGSLGEHSHMTSDF